MVEGHQDRLTTGGRLVAGVVCALGLMLGGHAAPALAAASCSEAASGYSSELVRCAYDTSSGVYDSEHARTVRAVTREAMRRAYGGQVTQLDTTPLGSGLPSPEDAAERLSGIGADGQPVTTKPLPGAIETLDGAQSGTARAVLADWLKAGRAAKLVPTFSRMLSIAGTGAEITGTALIGWQIGTFLRKTLIETAVDRPPAAADSWRLVPGRCADRYPNEGIAGSLGTWADHYAPDCEAQDDQGFMPGTVLEASVPGNAHVQSFGEVGLGTTDNDRGPACQSNPAGWAPLGGHWDTITTDGGTNPDGSAYYRCAQANGTHVQPRDSVTLPDDAQEVDRIRRPRAGETPQIDATGGAGTPSMPAPDDATVDAGVGNVVLAPVPAELARPYIAGAFGPQTVDAPDPDPSLVTVPSPEPGETAAAYAARLRDLGLLGSIEVLTTANPAFGPDAAVSTSPASGTRVGLGTTVTVQANPADAPVPPPATSDTPDPNRPKPAVETPGCGPTVPAVDLSPLKIGVGDRFPFAVPGWTLSLLGSWVGDATAPKFTVPFPFANPDPVIDLGWWDGAMPIWRGTMLFVSFVGLAWAFFSMALGFGGGDD